MEPHILTRIPTQLQTNRTGQAQSVLGNLRQRHDEVQRIEQSMREVAALMNELATLIEQQEVATEVIEHNAEQANVHLDEGNKQVNQATKHAIARRKKKWWCLFISILIVIVIALGIGLGIYFSNQAKNAATGGG